MGKGIFLQVFLAAFLVSPAICQNIDSLTQPAASGGKNKSFRLFEDEKPLEITLSFDLSTYFRSKPKEEYLSAGITFHLSKTDSISKNIRLRTRGEIRNQICTFSPIELNFKKAKFGYSDLNSISKIKMVPECRSGNENYVMREYLAYKMFNILTDTSFRVRLLTVNYIDTKKKRKPIKQYGFFIEPVEMLTARTKSVQVKSVALNQKSIIPKVMDRLAIFNYMIGNYDWAVPGQHNVKIIKALAIDTLQRGIAIPYDFDWSGLVNPSYAIPAENVGVETVRERLFLGVCRPRTTFQKDLAMFLIRKEEFYKVINDFPYLSTKEKRDMTDYLDEFFDQLVGRSTLVDYLLSSCKNF